MRIKMIKVGIIGTGNIGKRHLQSISSIMQEKEVFYYDSYKSSLDSVDTFVCENKLNIKPIKHNNLDSFLSNIDNNTVVIIATTANGRADLIKQIIQTHPKAIIAEKPVCQSLAEYDDILDRYSSQCPVYINFPRHMYPVYQDIFGKISFKNNCSVEINLNGVGLACNGIHMLDLVCWLFRGSIFSINSSENIKTFESKRKGFFDFSGKIVFTLNEKIVCTIQDSNANTINSIIMRDDKQIFQIYESLKKTVFIDNTSILVDNITIPYQSELTAKIILEIYANQSSSLLPTLEESYISHKILFDIMKNNEIELNIT